MDQTGIARDLGVYYDSDQDIFYLLFAEQAQEAIAEETADEVFVRFDPTTQQVISVEFLDFQARLEEVFGPELKYLGSEQPERLWLPTSN